MELREKKLVREGNEIEKNENESEDGVVEGRSWPGVQGPDPQPASSSLFQMTQIR